MGMEWSAVGSWLSQNAGAGAALVGSLLTGNIPGAVAAGVSMVTSATGESDPGKALYTLQNDPGTVLKLRELAVQEADSIRKHIRDMEELRLKDKAAAHHEQQETIRGGDKAEDEYVRHTRPKLARQAWYITAAYVLVFEGLKAAAIFPGGASLEIAMLLGSPAAAYLGFRTVDKFKRPPIGKKA